MLLLLLRVLLLLLLLLLLLPPPLLQVLLLWLQNSRSFQQGWAMDQPEYFEGQPRCDCICMCGLFLGRGWGGDFAELSRETKYVTFFSESCASARVA